MGGHYARHDGEPQEVAEALAEHYRPRAMRDSIPSTALGAILSVADRLDTLIGYLGVGIRFTGSFDPYGLRRQANGLLRILIEPAGPQHRFGFVGLSIDSLVGEGIESWGPTLTVKAGQLKRELQALLRERLEWIAFVLGEFAREQIAAVLEAGMDDPADAWDRLIRLHKGWEDSERKPVLLRAAKVAERTVRIVHSAKGQDDLGAVRPEAMTEPSEKRLWAKWCELKPAVEEQLQARNYPKAMEAYSRLYPQLHEFFEKVFVMDENLEVRRNRLALMKEIHRSMAERFADLSLLPLPAEIPGEAG